MSSAVQTITNFRPHNPHDMVGVIFNEIEDTTGKSDVYANVEAELTFYSGCGMARVPLGFYVDIEDNSKFLGPIDQQFAEETQHVADTAMEIFEFFMAVRSLESKVVTALKKAADDLVAYGEEKGLTVGDDFAELFL